MKLEAWGGMNSHSVNLKTILYNFQDIKEFKREFDQVRYTRGFNFFFILPPDDQHSKISPKAGC